MDAFACCVIDNRTQHCVRASRELRPHVDRTAVGPISYEIVDPLRSVRFSVGKNPEGLECDITFTATLPPHEEGNQFSKENGRVLENIKRYVQTGAAGGYILAGGRRFDLTPERYLCERDHSWGIRRGGGVPETGVQPGEIPVGYLHNFVVVQFREWGATFHLREDHDGRRLAESGALMSAEKNERRITSISHDYTFRRDIRQVAGGSIGLACEDGTAKSMTCRALSPLYLRAGGYFGYRDFVHGLWKGPEFLDGLTLDLTDPARVKELSFIEDVLCEFDCGGEKGYGIVEIVVVGRYPRYGYESW
jgi:hypothetical protein